MYSVDLDLWPRLHNLRAAGEHSSDEHSPCVDAGRSTLRLRGIAYVADSLIAFYLFIIALIIYNRGNCCLIN